MPSSLNIVATVTPDTVTNSISQVAHGLVVGDIIRRDSGGSYVKAQADSLANSLALGVVSQVVSADAFKFVQVGLINGLSGLVDGTQYYLDTATAGGTRTTETAVVGEVIKPVYIAISTTAAYVDIKKSDVVQAAAGGGAWEFISSTAMAGNDVFEYVIDPSTYCQYRFKIEKTNVTNTEAPYIILSQDGTNYITSGYQAFAVQHQINNSYTQKIIADNTSGMQLTGDTILGGSFGHDIDVTLDTVAAGGNTVQSIRSKAMYLNGAAGGNTNNDLVDCRWAQGTIAKAKIWLPSTTNSFTQGNIIVYALKRS